MTTTAYSDPAPSAPSDPAPSVPTAPEALTAPVPPVASVPPATERPSRSFRLVKTRQGRKLFGVCAGIARELDVDVTLIRVAFVGAAFAGFGIPLYIAAALLAPFEDPAG